MYAFVYRCGVIRVGTRLPRVSTALPLARGPRGVLTRAIEQLVPRVAGELLLRSLTTAGDDEAAMKAVEAFRVELDKKLPPENCSRFALPGEDV